MKNTGKYESTLEATVRSLGLAPPEAHLLELQRSAYHIDQLREDLAYCAERLSKNCLSFATEVKNGGTHMSSPTGSSLIGEISEKVAVLNDRTNSFPIHLRLVLGAEAAKEFFRIIRES
jgi:hypothetical protein